MAFETAFSMDTSSIKYGPGVTREVGWDIEELGTRRVMVVTDKNMTENEAVIVTLESLAKLMGADISGARPEEAGEVLSKAVVDLMRQVGMPNGLAAVGFGPDDVDKLVEGTLPQHRVTKLSPRPASAEDLKQLFLDSMTLW
jgi:alcohol dehydrogenase class IV